MIRFVLSLALAAPTGVASLPPGLQADAAMRAGEYAKAAKAYAVAFEAYEEPAFLWGMAEALRMDERCDDAVVIYEAYLELPVGDDAREAARVAIAQCKVAGVRIEGPFAPPPPPTPRRATDALLDYDDDVTVGRRPRVDPLGVTLVAMGGLATVAGAALMISAARVRRSGPSQSTESGFYATQEQAGRMGAAGAGVLVLGLTTTVVGAIRWGVVEKKRRRADRLGLAPGSVRVSF